MPGTGLVPGLPLPEASAAFAAGSLGLYLGHASERISIKLANPNLSVGIAPIPQLPGNQYPVNNTAHTYAFVIARTSKNAGDALTIAETIAGSAISGPLSDAFGMVSALRSASYSASTAAQTNTALSQAHNSLVGSATPDSVGQLIYTQAGIAHAWLDPYPQKTNDIFRAMIEDTASGAIRVQDAAGRADVQLGAIIDAQNPQIQK